MEQRLSKPEFAALFDEAARSLWCIAAAVLGDPAQADDALQEAAVIGLQKLDGFQPGSCFGAWMGQIVRNVARNLARRRHRDPRPASELAGLDPLDRPQRRIESEAVHESGALRDDQRSFDDRMLFALNSLNETARACLLLRVVLETPYREIARILDIPEGTAMSHVHRARAELRRILSGHDRAGALNIAGRTHSD